jgi:hypothetical protein
LIGSSSYIENLAGFYYKHLALVYSSFEAKNIDFNDFIILSMQATVF